MMSTQAQSISDGELEEALGAESTGSGAASGIQSTIASPASGGPKTLTLVRGEYPPGRLSKAATPKVANPTPEIIRAVAATKPGSKNKYESQFLTTMASHISAIENDTANILQQAKAGSAATKLLSGELTLVRRTVERTHTQQIANQHIMTKLIDLEETLRADSSVPSLIDRPPSYKRRRSGSTSGSHPQLRVGGGGDEADWGQHPADPPLTPAQSKALNDLHASIDRSAAISQDIVGAINTSTQNQGHLIELIGHNTNRLASLEEQVGTNFHNLTTLLIDLQGTLDTFINVTPKPRFGEGGEALPPVAKASTSNIIQPKLASEILHNLQHAGGGVFPTPLAKVVR
jgi:hypothetical protein